MKEEENELTDEQIEVITKRLKKKLALFVGRQLSGNPACSIIDAVTSVFGDVFAGLEPDDDAAFSKTAMHIGALLTIEMCAARQLRKPSFQSNPALEHFLDPKDRVRLRGKIACGHGVHSAAAMEACGDLGPKRPDRAIVEDPQAAAAARNGID
jgi:hypothetical protein